MFANAYRLEGGNGTKYSWVNDNKTYARIDKPGQPGYFTEKEFIDETKIVYTTEDDKWVIDSDGNWIYIFEVYSDDDTYYVWEDDYPGYTSTASVENMVTVDGSTEVVIVNKEDGYEPPPDPEYGSLKVSKTVAGDDLPRDDNGKYVLTDFSFTVTLKDGGENLTGTKIFGSHIFTNGVATFRLRDGQTVEFTDIPAGLTYTVEETAREHFDMTVNNGHGVIVKDTAAEVSFTNTWNDTSPKNSFTLAKKVINGSSDDSFDFTVLFTGLYPSFTYQLSSGGSFTANSSGVANVGVSLKADESVSFRDLPIGAKYRVTEAASDYIASFAISDENDLKLIKSSRGANASANTELSTMFETVDEGEVVTVTFTNEKEDVPPPPELTSLEVKKIWSGDDPDDRPDSILVYLCQNDDILKSEFLSSANNWSATFDDLPLKDEFGENYVYTAKEAAVDGYKVSYGKEGDTFVITNTKVPVGSAEISKTVEGEGADLNKSFRFTLKLTDADGENVTASYPCSGITYSVISFINGAASVFLKHDQTLTVDQLPAGYKLSVTESEVASYEIRTPEAKSYTDEVISADDTLQLPFVNVYNGIADLSVKKLVYSTYESDRQLAFGFEIIIKNEDGSNLNGDFETDGTDIDSLTFTDGKAQFSLKDSQTLSIKRLPVGARYEIREINTGGVKFDTFSTNEKGVILRDSEKNNVIFSNQRFTLPYTGGSNIIIGASIVSGCLIAMGAFLIIKALRKKRGSDSPAENRISKG